MSRTVSRRHFLVAAPVVAGLAAATAQDPPPAKEVKEAKPAKKAREKKPPLDAEQVKAFVIAAHKNLDDVKTLYEKQPALLNATMDWGGGDFETALGGASHTGQRAIALFLLEKGARLDIFAATMLGQLDVVKAVVAANPGIVKSPGPHGIPLIDHAKMGKKDAEAVLKYLETLK
ncbi:MAG: ankyrin repeat domain-containing protein [Gemmataceae bacterium]